jgi:hypothetical protein
LFEVGHGRGEDVDFLLEFVLLAAEIEPVLKEFLDGVFGYVEGLL